MANVKLVSYTQPPYPMETLTDLVAYCARVSNPSNQLNNETCLVITCNIVAHFTLYIHYALFFPVVITLEM